VNLTSAILQAWDEPYQLTEEQVAFYRENGFIKLNHVFTPEQVAQVDVVITAEVNRRNTERRPMEERDTYSKAFLQIMNLWTTSPAARSFVFSKRLARIAAALMQVQGVRLYHDQALYKEPGGGITPWHADQYYWPLDSDRSVTAWIPLQATPMEMGPLEFSAGSIHLTTGRNLKIGDESQQVLADALAKGGYQRIAEPFNLGEVSFHAGWLYHRAGPNQTSAMRKVMTVIYIDRDIRLANPLNPNQQEDWDTWCPGARVGEIIDTVLNPVLYENQDH